MPIVRNESGEMRWMTESEAKPTDMKLWRKARMLALADKDYSPHYARVVTARLYRMLGGLYEPRKKSKTKRVL